MIGLWYVNWLRMRRMILFLNVWLVFKIFVYLWLKSYWFDFLEDSFILIFMICGKKKCIKLCFSYKEIILIIGYLIFRFFMYWYNDGFSKILKSLFKYFTYIFICVNLMLHYYSTKPSSTNINNDKVLKNIHFHVSILLF